MAIDHATGRGGSVRRRGDGAQPRGPVEVLVLVPAADARADGNREQRAERKPGDAALALRNDDPGGQQRPHGTAGIAADLKNRLRQSVAAARGQARDARGFRMENRGARADQGAARQHASVARRQRQGQKPKQREAHADAQGIRLWMFVGVDADQGLQQGGAHLIGEGDGADLHETQVEFAFEQRINGDDQRLHHVVEEMREADGAEHAEARLHCAMLWARIRRE